MDNDRPTVNGINTESVVYRIDPRSFEEIRIAGGHFPRTPPPGRQMLHDLTYHFQGDGEIPDSDSDVSALVATSSNIGTVVCHGHVRGLIGEDEEGRLEYDDNFVAYIYEVRPNHYFYNLERSFEIAANEAQALGDLDRVNRIRNATNGYLGMHEYVAHEGFGVDRIIRYAALTGELLNEHGLEVLQDEAFWDDDDLWTLNNNNDDPSCNYNPSYNADTTSPYPYLDIATPTGRVLGMTNVTLPETEDSYNERGNFIRLSETFLGIETSAPRMRRSTELRNTSSRTIFERMRLKTLFNDSEYYIRSSVARNVVVDLSKNSQGANIHAYEDLALPNQKWKLSYHKGRRAYRIMSVQNQNLCLTAGTSWDVTAETFESDKGINQYWIPEITKDGLYTIRSYFVKDLFLALENGATANGTNIRLYRGNTNNAQKWEITSRKFAVLPDGEYQIRSSINSNVVVDLSKNSSGANVWAYENGYHSNQKWKFYYIKEKRAYKIVSSQNAGLCLTWNSQVDSNVMGYDESKNYKDQFWIIEETKDGFYILRNYYDLSKVLDLEKSLTANETNIITFAIHNDKNQKWSIERVGTPIIPNGIYTISTKLNYKKVLDYTSPPHYNVVIWEYMNLKTSDFRMEYDVQKQAYAIYSAAYDNLGIVFQSTNALLKLDTIDDNMRGYWFIEYEPNNGGYLIRSAYDPQQVIDLDNSKLSNESTIYAFKAHLGKNQIWNFRPKVKLSSRKKDTDF